MAEIVVGPVAEKIVESLFVRIGRHLGYMWNYHSNLLDVSKQIEKLRDGIFRLQQSVDEANRQGDEIFPDVEKWLPRARKMIRETDKFIADEKQASRGCFNLKLRYQQSKKAKNQAADIVNEIQEADNLIKGGVAHRPSPPGIPFSSVTGGTSEVLKSREATLDQIMEALRDDGIRMIGVWGMGGVGKSTLVQQLAKRAQVAKQANEEKLFDAVVMALNISQTPSVTKIQGEIASVLGLRLDQVTDESERAVRLSQSLKKHEKILVILDDIWEPISFETIGIPYGSSHDHPMGYCKVLLTSREHDLLSKDMGTHKNFHVEHLCSEDAWSLFKETVGDSVEKPELQPTATEVVKECEGLPVAIVTIAKALKGESVSVWNNALMELRNFEPTNIRGVSKKVYSCLMLSYNYLESHEAKSVFLLCGLLSDGDISLDDLLKNVMALDLFDYMDSLETARNKVVALVKNLKASSLLLDVVEDAQTYREPPSLFFVEEEGNGYVRMHDVIRDVARSIASKDPHRLLVKEDVSLQEWENKVVELRNCTGMSLKCTRVQELPKALVCPKLEIFSLESKNYSLKIPDTFFEDMKEVRVLSLSVVDLGQLPSSLHSLSNLRTLCLHGYHGNRWTLEGITMVRELKKLQILSFKNCEIGELPEAMKQLTDLRMLSLKGCPAIIPRNVISSLSRLEHLCLKNIFYSWEEREGADGRGERNAWFSDLKNMSCLRALEVRIPSSFLLPDDASFDNLTGYDIYMGFHREVDLSIRRNTSRGLKLDFVKGPDLVKFFSKQLKTIKVLDLSYLDDIEHFVHELDRHGFLQLKYLSIFSSDSVHYIINTMELEMEMERVDPPPCAFPLLEELRLGELHQLEAVWHGPIPMGCFANLTVLLIQRCRGLKYVLSLPTTQGRELVLIFPQLRRLELDDLPNLTDFYSTVRGSQELLITPLFNQVEVPRLELLSLASMDNVRRMWHNQHPPVGFCCELKELRLSNCKNLQTVFPSNFLQGTLQRLKNLVIEECPSLEEVFEKDNIIAVVPPQRELNFRNLNSLMVGGCSSLKHLFPTSVAKGLVQLEVLTISYSGVVAIVANDQNGLDDHAVVPLIFCFPRLTTLRLDSLWQLKRFYEQEIMYTLECPVLKELEVCGCDNVELLFQEKGLQNEVDKQPLFLVDKNSFRNVEVLKLGLKGSLEIMRGQFSRESFGKLRNLEIIGCHNISVAISPGMLEVWNNIERLTLRSCYSVKEVFQAGVIVGETETVLPQLTEMQLYDLPMLTHIFGFGSVGFGFRPFLLPNLRSLDVSKCGNLINIVSPSMAKRLVQLKKLRINNCSMVKEIVGDDGDESQEEPRYDNICSDAASELRKPPALEHSVDHVRSLCSASNYTLEFPSLENMEVYRLPNLTHLHKKIPGISHNLQNLRDLTVFRCGNIEIVLTLSMAKTLGQLQKLSVRHCDKVKEILENIEGGDDQSMDDDEIVFTKLQRLTLLNLPNLKSFCSARYSFSFPCLTDTWISKCSEMEFFCKGGLITPSLERVLGSSFLWESHSKESNLNAVINKLFRGTNPKEVESYSQE